MKRIAASVIVCLVTCTATVFAQSENGGGSDAETEFFNRGRNTETGTIAGHVTDGSNDEDMIGAAVKIEGTRLGAICDLDGNFIIRNVPVGTHTVTVSMVGYQTETIENVVVSADEETTLDATINPEDVEVEEVTVKARAIRESGEVMMKERQESEAVTDAVSADEMSQAGSGNAAEAMKQVTGASVVEGKRVYVRGLGDRYTNIQLNGSELPSTSQYNQTVQIDLFPTELVSNIVTQKTFTPDKPGSFTGGSVNIETKSFPDHFTLNFSASTSFLANTSLKDNFLTYEGGSTDWLGMDDGSRDVPAAIKAYDGEFPTIGYASQDMEVARDLDRLSTSFNNVMAPTSKSAPLNQSYSLSVGDQLSLFNRPLGYFGSLTYSRSYSTYENGTSARWELTDPNAGGLKDYMVLGDHRSTDDVLWGGLMNVSYRVNDDHELGINLMHSQNGESMARSLSGSYHENLAEGRVFEPNVLSYNERRLSSVQFRGEHTIRRFNGAQIQWRSSLGESRQDEPDLRYFSYSYADRGDRGRYYTVFANFYDGPTRYYRSLEETNNENAIDVTVPFTQWNDLESKFKFGGLYSTKERSFSQEQYVFGKPGRLSDVRFNGDAYDYFGETNRGMVDSTATPYVFGMVVMDYTTASGIYDGEQDIGAFYSMVDLALTGNLQFIGGVRYESTDMKVANPDTVGTVNVEDYLPSVNFRYTMLEDMNVRLGFSRTLARPTIREMAPYDSFDYAAGNFFSGNPALKRTLITNWDARWEWFGRPGEVYSVSAFYKDMKDPIERVIKNYNGEITFQNVDEALVSGLEFEARKNLDTWLPHVRIGGNLSLVKSEVTISEDEMVLIRAYDPDASNKREFMGQSPYILNFDISYDNPDNGLTASLYYNVFGDRLSENSLGGTPDVYEKSRSQLNVSAGKSITEHITLKMSAKNLLESDVSRVYEYKGTEYKASHYETGRSYSLGLSYSL